jgi:hypothetical protein
VMIMMVTLSVKGIPLYLRCSAFARAIEDDGGTIDVPASCYKSNTTIKDNTDLSLLLSTLRFWGVDMMPREVLLYIIWKKPQEVLHSTDDYGRELRYLAFLQTLCAKTALSCGESASDYFGYNEKLVWSSDPAEAAAQICLIHYDTADGDIWTVNTTALAARLGQPHALKFLHENGCPWDESTCSSAASKGHLSCLQYAHENGCGWDAETGTEASRNGHLPCLKYACENGCPTDVESLSRSMWHTACFEYLRKNGFLTGAARSCASAARTNNLALLMKLHSEGCQWDERTCEAATQASSFECLQYAHENGCPWDSKTCSQAIQHANTNCLRYAVEQGCPLAADILCHAALYLPCLEYLHERGVAWHKEVCEQAAFLGRGVFGVRARARLSLGRPDL